MASTHKHIRSGTANKRPTTAIADGQIALNTNLSSPGLFFKDSTGAEILKIGPVHVGATAPNASPAGSAGNSTGEIWLDTSLTPVGVKIWNGSAFVNATPIGSTTVQGLLELATNAETQAGADTARAVTSASLQSKLSDSTSTTSATTIASSTAVKAAYDLANAALPKTGGTVTGNLEIGTAGSLSFEGATADGFETTIAVVDPTADRTITLPNTTGTVVTTGDTGTVTSTMILDGTIVNADINASAAIVDTKLATIATAGKVSNSATTAASANTASAIVARDASGNFTAGTITAALTGAASSNVLKAGDTMTGALVHPLGAAATPSLTFTGDLNTGIYSPGADQVAVATNGTERMRIDSSGNITVDTNTFYVDAANNRVGIGTSSPSNTAGFSQQLQLTGNLPCISIDNTGTGANKYSLGVNASGAFGIWDNTVSGYRMYINSSGLVGIGTTSPTRQLDVRSTAFFDSNGDGTGTSPSIAIGSTSVGLSYVGGGHLSFTTGSAEKARIDSSGRLLIGTSTTASAGGVSAQHAFSHSTSSQWAAAVQHTTAAGNAPLGLVIKYTAATPNNTSSEFLYCEDATAIRAAIRSNGGLANYSANNSNLSDRNAKKDISPAAGTWDCIKEWEIVNYRYKDQPDDANLNLGVIAQQVAESCPEVITVFEEAKDDQPEKLGVKEQQMYWMAIKALQEAQVRIEQLEAKVAALEAA